MKQTLSLEVCENARAHVQLFALIVKTQNSSRAAQEAYAILARFTSGCGTRFAHTTCVQPMTELACHVERCHVSYPVKKMKILSFRPPRQDVPLSSHPLDS